MHHTTITITRDAASDNADEITLELPIAFTIAPAEPDVGIMSAFVDAYIDLPVSAVVALKLTETEQAQVALQLNEINPYDYMN